MGEAGHLDALARAATVHILPAGDGSGDDRSTGDGRPAMWGSGFFVAPGWVLTCAHVLRPYVRPGRERVFRVRNDVLNGGTPVEARLAHWLVTDAAKDRVPVAEDLALVRLLDEDVEHECVWFTDRADQPGGDRKTAYGYRPGGPGDDPAVPWSADVEINQRDGPYGMRFAPQAEFPKGTSGGPVLDPSTGAVVGIIKSRRADRDGGMAIAASALRQFGGLYGEVLAAHDRWHGVRSALTPYHWAAEQAKLPGSSPTADGDRWTPLDRVEALGLLAELAAPAGSSDLAALVRQARGEPPPPGRPPLLHTWRDGHGRLYGNDGPLEAIAFLHYLRLVALLVEHRDGDAKALADWVDRRLRNVRPPVRAIVTLTRLPEALTAPAEPESGRDVIPYPGPGEGPTVVVELEPVHYEEPERFYWRIRVDDGDDSEEPFEAEETGRGVLPEDLIRRLRQPLAEVFEGVDTAGCPAPLEVVLPVDHFDTAVHRWQLSEMAKLYDTAHLPLGAHRRVVLRDIARRGEPANVWLARWELTAESVEFAASRTPPPGRPPRSRQFQDMPPAAIPVLCRPASTGLGRKAIDLALEAGHGIALWHTDGHTASRCLDDCDTFHAGAAEVLGRLGSAAELPDRLRRIREEIHRERDAGHWAEAVAVLYDDPRRPVAAGAPGTLDSP
ncbi:trypsin-like peptidase domain-containing protein [Streptomyces sp. NPDC048639]|uniref:VMAP-C domain-containing protein n=1 Tax=Streptomyces sp. NPDC048639 TaxID=3365581 RepID=UPI003710878A